MSDLSQSEADNLLKMTKEAADRNVRVFPAQGGYLEIPLKAVNAHEAFILSINRKSRISARITYQTRARQTVILARLDFGTEHRNPDGRRVGSPHIHVYREGFGDKWAYELPHPDFDLFDGANTDDEWFTRFLDFCAIKHDNILLGGGII